MFGDSRRAGVEWVEVVIAFGSRIEVAGPPRERALGATWVDGQIGTLVVKV